MKNRTAGQEKGPTPRRVAVRVWLEEEDFQLLKTRASDHERTPGDLARHLLANAIRSFWAYEGRRIRRGEEPAIAAARDFLLELYDRQGEALKAVQSASYAATGTASASADQCQRWIDAEKAHRSRASAGLKVIDGKFRPALKGSAS
jgi:hypothetical protein